MKPKTTAITLAIVAAVGVGSAALLTFDFRKSKRTLTNDEEIARSEAHEEGFTRTPLLDELQQGRIKAGHPAADVIARHPVEVYLFGPRHELADIRGTGAFGIYMIAKNGRLIWANVQTDPYSCFPDVSFFNRMTSEVSHWHNNSQGHGRWLPLNSLQPIVGIPASIDRNTGVPPAE